MGKLEHGQIWAVTIAAILLLQIVSFGVSSNDFIPQAEAQSNFLTYENPIFGIKIQYPSGWEKVERPEANLVAFLSPFDSVFDKIQENVVLSYKKSDESTNLIEASDKIIQRVKKTVTDLTILESEKTILSGFNAYKSVYTVTLPGGDLQMKQMLIVTIVDEKLYQIIFTSESEKYSNYLPIAQKILDSLVIETDFYNPESTKIPTILKLDPLPPEVFIEETQEPEGGGCLIATATFGSEMAPQVQFLREIRDSTVLQTESGTSFMTTFNQFYYSFSPALADYERENPTFKEAVKLTLTPLLISLTLLQYADIDSESEMLGYGIGIILLNIGMYFVAPAVLIMKIRKSR